MKKINFHKVSAVFSILGVMGLIGLGFQNFVPHDSFKGNDSADLYMSTALTDALKSQEKENRAHLAEESSKKKQKVSAVEGDDRAAAGTSSDTQTK